MNLKLTRKVFTRASTIGSLEVDSTWGCHTLEDIDRHLEFYPEKKISKMTAIPRGKYEIVINWSNRFKRMMPLLLDVQGFTGIRIHSGNTEADTEGCILVGQEWKEGWTFIQKSHLAFDSLFKLLMARKDQEKIWIEIV